MSSEGTIAIEHPRFGRVEVPGADVIRFDALPGFPTATRFALLAHDRHESFAWLVSLDVPDLAFVVADPWQFFADYEPGIDSQALETLGAKTFDDVDVLAMVTLREGSPTLNLLAPLLLCGDTRRGMQLILDEGRYSACQPLVVSAVAPSAPAAHTESKPQT